MDIICKGITLSGRQCHRKTKLGYCSQHRKEVQCKYRQAKPEECPICCESLDNQRRSLACGHWIHKKCIIQSAKAECPICRTILKLGVRDTKRITKLAKRRHTENLADEEEELRQDLQYQITGLLAPALRDRIEEVVGNLLEDIEDLDATDVLTDILDEEAYQSFLTSLIGYDMLESEYIDSDEEDY